MPKSTFPALQFDRLGNVTLPPQLIPQATATAYSLAIKYSHAHELSNAHRPT